MKHFETPNGYVGDHHLELSDELAEMAKGQILSMETARNGEVFLWSRKKEWEEEDEQVAIVHKDHSPSKALEELIRMVNQMARPEGE